MRPALKRGLWTSLAIVVFVVGAIGAIFGITFMGNAKLRDGEAPLPFARIVVDGFVSVAVLDMGHGKVALIDAGNDPEARGVLRALAAMHKTRADVAGAFLTHGHQDHVNGLHALRGVNVYGLAEEATLVAGLRENRAPLTRFFKPKPTGLAISHPLHDGDAVSLGNRTVRVFATPGHTAGSASYYVDGLVFLGDSADASSEHKVTPAKWLFTDDTAQNIASLQKLEARLREEKLDVKHLVFAHTGTLPGLDALSAFNRSH